MRRVLLAFEPPDGGVAEHVAQLAVRLAEHGWQAEIAGPPEAIIYPQVARAGVRVHRLPFARGHGDIRRDLAGLRALSRLVSRASYDVVHCHSAKAGVLGRLAARRARVPVVYTPHALPFVGPFAFKRRVGARLVEQALAPMSARIICVSDHERQEANRARLGARRLRVVHNGCARCDPAGSPDRELQELRGGGRLVAAVAVLRRQKRLDLLLEAAPEILRRVPDARVAVVGNGPLAGALRTRAAQLGLDAEPRFGFVAFSPPAGRYLRALDVFVLASDWESMPIAVLEALACGVPQVASRVGGTPEAVTEETSVLFPPGDVAALAEATVAMLEDEPRRRRMAEASRARHGAAFTVERMVTLTAGVYDEVLRSETSDPAQ